MTFFSVSRNRAVAPIPLGMIIFSLHSQVSMLLCPIIPQLSFQIRHLPPSINLWDSLPKSSPSKEIYSQVQLPTLLLDNLHGFIDTSHCNGRTNAQAIFLWVVRVQSWSEDVGGFDEDEAAVRDGVVGEAEHDEHWCIWGEREVIFGGFSVMGDNRC